MLNADGEGQYLGGTVEAITESEVNATLVALTVRSEYTGKLYELQMDPYLDKCIECWEATND